MTISRSNPSTRLAINKTITKTAARAIRLVCDVVGDGEASTWLNKTLLAGIELLAILPSDYLTGAG
jgi:hypothetical protein